MKKTVSLSVLRPEEGGCLFSPFVALAGLRVAEYDNRFGAHYWFSRHA